MSNILDQIIREVFNKNTPVDSNSEVMIVTDDKGTIPVKRSGLMSAFSSDRYFIVNTFNTIVYNGHLCTLYNGSGTQNVNIDYRLRCLPAEAERFALKIASSRSPVILNNLLQLAVEELNSQVRLTEDFYAKKPSAESALIAGLKDIGLTAVYINIQIDDNRNSPKPVKLDIGMFKAPLKQVSLKAALGLTAEVIVIAGQEAKALSFNMSAADLEDIVINITKKSLAENITAETLYSNHNTSVRNELISHVNMALEPCGRQLSEYNLAVHKQGVLDSIVLATEDFISVRVKESHQVLKLKYKCELVTESSLRGTAFLFAVNNTDMNVLVENTVKTALAEQVGIEEFADAIKTIVPAKVAKAINEAVIPWGRRVGFLELEHDRKLPPRDIEIKHMVICTTKDGYKVTVNNTLLLQRDYNSHKVFEASQVEDFDSWGKTQLDRITKNFIITNTYNQLLYEMQDESLRQQMQKEAEKIGYLINHLITVPEFEGIKRSERFKIEYKNTIISSKADGVPVAISIYSEGRVRNFKKIIDLLAPAELLSVSMHNAIDAKVSHFFHSVEPDRFYTRFYTADITKGDGLSLEEEIRQMVKKLLSEIYDADASEITVNQMDTKLIQRLKELQEGLFTCDYSDRASQFNLRSHISVLNVDADRWQVFNGKGYKPRSEDPGDNERKDIARLIREFMGNVLDTRLVPLATRGEIDSLEIFLTEAHSFCKQVEGQVKELFGLNVEIFKPLIIKDNITTAEDTLKNDMREMYLREKKERLRLLYTRRKDRESSHAAQADPELKRVNDEITKIENEIFPDRATDSLNTAAGKLFNQHGLLGQDAGRKKNFLTDNQ